MFLLVDIGGTKIRLAVSRDGTTFDEPTIIPTPENFPAAISQIQNQAQKLLGHTNIKAAAVGVPGPLNKNKTMVVSAPNLPNWHNQPLKDELAQALHTPLFIENDADLAGLGEATTGAGQDFDIVAYLTISTGVGGTRIVNKKIDHGAFSFEPGHQIIQLDDNSLSTLENCVSGTGLKKRYGKPAEQISDPDIWVKTVKLLAIGLNNITVHWSPHCIILGGSVMQSVALDKLQKQFNQTVTIFPSAPQLKLAALGDNAGLAGALAYLQHELN